MPGTIEIGAYLRGLGWRAVLAGILVLSAAAGPALFVLLQPARYAASAAVRLPVPASGNAAEGTSDDGAQFAADVAGALSLESTKTALAAEAGVPEGRLQADLSVARAGSARSVDVIYVARSKARARRVARLAAAKALTTIQNERLAVVNARLEVAGQRAAAAQQLGPGDHLLTTYQVARTHQARLEVLIAQRLARGDQAGAQAVAGPLESARAGTAQAAAELTRHQQAAAPLGGAQQAIDEARREAAQLDEQIRAATAEPTVGIARVRRAIPVKQAAEAGIAGLIAAGTLCFALIGLGEIRAVLRRRRTAGADPAPQPLH